MADEANVDNNDKALDLYQRAGKLESNGRLNDALAMYRQAY